MGNRNYGHPCFGKDAASKIGRIHLPVAQACNIKCNYCDRNISCMNENHPGACLEVLTPEQALERYKRYASSDSRLKIVGISGPGDPLFNPETFKTFELIKSYDKGAIFCISTNGLLLEDRIEDLLKSNVRFVTVTVNAVNFEVAKEIYEFALYDEVLYFGEDAAKLLVEKQQKGIEKACKAGLVVKVNTVLIPDINQDHIEEIAKVVKALGVSIMNIMPLRPYAKFSHLKRPSCDTVNNIRKRCESIIDQISHCNQCRSDAIGMLMI
ncbi:radical SAM protein [Caldicellulosiruptor sp. DIB 104C]|uniref:radical SAM protein n=1 Tax=Caldicellulosiruptor sp. DIB 104C TaxID=3019889 RepID=UPI002305DA4D|nr:radical SAM protein [Caldicellulosiruptor sp. DIB 104C]